MNRVQLIGDIVWPVEVRTDSVTGRTFGRIMLAVSADTDPLVFVPLVLKDREAMDAAVYLGEGSRVQVSGHLHSALVTDHNKRTRRVVRVIADSVTYLNLRTPQSGSQR